MGAPRRRSGHNHNVIKRGIILEVIRSVHRIFPNNLNILLLTNVFVNHDAFPFSSEQAVQDEMPEGAKGGVDLYET